MSVESRASTVCSSNKEVGMDESRSLEGPSAEELAERLGELLSDDDMENIVGGSKEFSFLAPQL
jgi:hypothetical protein